LELYKLGNARQEMIHEDVIIEWINTFMDMNISFDIAIAKIRMCKSRINYYGKTTFGDIYSADTSEYHKFYVKK
jgi:hypothetical protein